MNENIVDKIMEENSSDVPLVKTLNIFVMDSLGPVNNNELIKEQPVRLLIAYRVNDPESEITYHISLSNPWNQLASKYSGILDYWVRDFSVILPIKHISGTWVLDISITGSTTLQRIYQIILP